MSHFVLVLLVVGVVLTVFAGWAFRGDEGQDGKGGDVTGSLDARSHGGRSQGDKDATRS